MNKKVIIILSCIAVLAFLLLFLRGSEDTWIKDDKGIYVKHGNPSSSPDYVLNQQELINKAKELFAQKKSEGMQFSSQCLGTIDDYAVDIVHVPRAEEDNNIENQCPDFREGKVKETLEIVPEIFLDIDAESRPLYLEIIGAKEKLGKENTEEISMRNLVFSKQKAVAF